MRFQVPQYIDVEDKLLGPLSFKQVVFVAGGAGALVALYILFPSKIIGVLLGAIILMFGLLLAFYKPNNKPFQAMLEAIFSYYRKSRLYLWKHIDRPTNERLENVGAYTFNTGSQLSQKGWNLDAKGIEEHNKLLEKKDKEEKRQEQNAEALKAQEALKKEKNEEGKDGVDKRKKRPTS
jgi:hypothetical protein